MLYEIHLYSLSESLVLTCRRLWDVFTHSPNSLRVAYLLARCTDRRPHPKVLSRALRFPACSMQVLDLLLREHFPSPDDRIIDLPRRLFKDISPRTPSQPPWHRNDEPLPFLHYLFRHTRPSVNANDGYALTRAVYAGHDPLIRYLLEHGADPECKGGMAVLIAIRRKDKHTVRMLIERDYIPPVTRVKRRLKHAADIEDQLSPGPTLGGAKKRKLGDRVSVSKEMMRAAQEAGAEELVTYFLSEKGCVPDIQTLTMMGSGVLPRGHNRQCSFYLL
jgi:ankyrin repeat protein